MFPWSKESYSLDENCSEMFIKSFLPSKGYLASTSLHAHNGVSSTTGSACQRGQGVFSTHERWAEDPVRV